MATSATSAHPFRLVYDPGLDCLRGYWLVPVADKRLRMHYAQMLATASAHGYCRFWLLDLRGRNLHTPTFGRWYGTAFAQAVHAALLRPVFIAYVLGPEHYAPTAMANAPAMLRGCATHHVHPVFFDNEAAAYEWLAHQQALDKE